MPNQVGIIVDGRKVSALAPKQKDACAILQNANAQSTIAVAQKPMWDLAIPKCLGQHTAKAGMMVCDLPKVDFV
jgi:hypothetical protein